MILLFWFNRFLNTTIKRVQSIKKNTRQNENFQEKSKYFISHFEVDIFWMRQPLSFDLAMFITKSLH